MHRLHVNPFSLHLHSSQHLPIRTTCSLAMWTRASQRPLICRNSSILTPTLRPCWCSKRALKSPLTLYRSVTAADSYYSLLSIHSTFVHKKVHSLFFFMVMFVLCRLKEWKSKLLMSSCQTTDFFSCHVWSIRNSLMSSVLSNSFIEEESKRILHHTSFLFFVRDY